MDAHLTDDMPHRNTLIYLNPDHLYRWSGSDCRPRRAAGPPNVIGYWWWEIDAFPEKWRVALDLLDEIWVNSDFVGNVIRRATDKTVIKIPHTIDVALDRLYARADFSLPERKFLFLFTFDFDSFIERKNPLATIEAFGRAFPAGDDRVGLRHQVRVRPPYPRRTATCCTTLAQRTRASS